MSEPFDLRPGDLVRVIAADGSEELRVVRGGLLVDTEKGEGVVNNYAPPPWRRRLAEAILLYLQEPEADPESVRIEFSQSHPDWSELTGGSDEMCTVTWLSVDGVRREKYMDGNDIEVFLNSLQTVS